MTFEQYLRDAYARQPVPVIDHILRVQPDAHGRMWFYIHPFGRDGSTTEFKVDGHQLIPYQPGEVREG